MIDRPKKPANDVPRDAGKDDPEKCSDNETFKIEGFIAVEAGDLDGIPDIPGFRPEDRENIVELVRDPEGPLANVSLIKEADGEEEEFDEAALEAYITELAKKHNIPREKIIIRFDGDDDC